MDTLQTLTFPGRFDSLADISEFVARAAEAAGLDAHAIYEVQMAVDEACSNIIEHAYGGEGRGPIECTCRIRDGELTVTLCDQGHPFDPTSVPEPDLHANLKKRKSGGLGLYFIRQLMDNVHFEFTPDSGNVLTLVKRKEVSSSSNPSQLAEHLGWRQFINLGAQLAILPTAAAQREFIIETAARLVRGQADLWLIEPFHHLPGFEESTLFPVEPPSDLLRRVLDSGGVEKDSTPAIAVPLRTHDTILGALEVKRPGRLPFSDAEIELLDGLTTQSAIALQSTHQVEVERWRVKQLSLVRTVSAQVANVLDLDVLLNEVVTLIHEQFSYPFVHLFTVDPAHRQIVYRAGSPLPSPKGEPERERLAYGLDDPEGITPWVARYGETVLANDVSHDPRYRPSRLPPANTQAELAVPLVFGGQVLGVLDVQSDRRNAFGDDDRFLFEALADNVAIAIRNANLYRSEQWRRQVADSMREVAGLLSAGVALDHVLDAILTELERTLPCDAAAIWLLQGDDLCMAAVRGYEAEVCIGDFSPIAGPWLNQVLHADQPTIRTPQSPPEPLGTTLEFPPDYSTIAAPLHIGDRRLGLLTLAHRTPGRYGAESRAMTAAFASYAAVAIENTRLYQAAQEQAYVSTVLLQVAEATQSLTTLDQVLETIVRLTPMLVGVDQCAILLWNEPTAAFVPSAAYGLNPTQQAAFDRWRIAPGDVPAFDHLYLSKTPAVIHDTVSDPRLAGAGISVLGFKSLLLLPLLAHSAILGAMLIDYRGQQSGFSPPWEPTDERLAIIRGIAYQAASAVENAQLLEAQQEEAYVSAALLQVAQAIVSFSDLDEVLRTIVRITPILVGVERCIIFLWDDERSIFWPAQTYGILRDIETSLLARRYAPGDFPLLDAVRERNSPIAHSGEDGLTPLDFMADFTDRPQGETCALLAVPLSVKGDVLGVMLVEETDIPRGPSERRQEIITGIAHQAALAVQNDLLQQEMAERERLERELQLAREIQQTFIPSQLPHLPGWELAVIWRAARQVAGDFYDFFELPGGRLGLVIADVADKGMPAALFMALTRALVRAAALEEMSPAAALARVNDLLVPDAQHGMFVTAVYAVLSLETGELTYANAGHNPPLLLRHHPRELERFGTGGIALGVLEGVRLEERVVSLKPGDHLILYTDGVTEAFSPQNDIYGEERLRSTIQTADSGSAQAMLNDIDGSVLTFVGDLPPSDDLTLLVLCRLK